jgi:hypothetical protein
MGIEFINEPPKSAEDLKRDERVERLKASVGVDTGVGRVDPIFCSEGEKDSAKVFASIIDHANPKDLIDLEATRQMLYEISENLSDAIKVSYRRGVDMYFDRMVQIAKKHAEEQ